jgi:hypothetical protein
MHPSDDLPEDHEALLRLAQDTTYGRPGSFGGALGRALPRQDAAGDARTIAIPDEAHVLVDGPLVGFSTHGR